MHCPNCGKKTTTQQKFCRACGLSLHEFALLLAEQLPSATGSDPEGVARLIERHRKVERLLSVFGTLFLATLFGSLIFAIIYSIIIVGGKIFEGLILLSLILGAAASLALALYRQSLKNKLANRTLHAPAQTQSMPTGELLTESRFEPVLSATERTTELLAVEERRVEKSRRQ